MARSNQRGLSRMLHFTKANGYVLRLDLKGGNVLVIQSDGVCNDTVRSMVEAAISRLKTGRNPEWMG